MVIKFCEFCHKEMNVKKINQRFCSKLCQIKNYKNQPEIKKKIREYAKKYRRTHPEWKERHNFLELTKHRERRAKYWKDYGKRPEVRARIREKEKQRRKIDPEFAIADRLRRSLLHALTKYSKTGKIMSSKKYGIDWKNVIESLKPFPKDIKNFEIDHIIPLHTFDLTKEEEVKKAFSSSNLQWLTIEQNRRKSGKVLNKSINSNELFIGE